ncbi:MAG TPA: hypothetical protein PK823_18440 [Novosphingobium sp.]|nr:MAG: hypothetical protein B7X78_09525 [Sphingomonadales bacterium 39-62-4]HQS98463.1 hypothetical protein [Novosphingobium sp.]
MRLTAANARLVPVSFEARIARNPEVQIKAKGTKLTRKDGREIWAVTIPANSTVALTYILTDE